MQELWNNKSLSNLELKVILNIKSADIQGVVQEQSFTCCLLLGILMHCTLRLKGKKKGLTSFWLLIKTLLQGFSQKHFITQKIK